MGTLGEYSVGPQAASEGESISEIRDLPAALCSSKASGVRAAGTEQYEAPQSAAARNDASV